MSQCKPRTFVITDGSGRNGVSRMASTTRILERFKVPCGEIFGCISDAGIYRAILQQDLSLFLDLTERLASALVRYRIDFVAGDATEGYNTSHDLCRVMVNAAVHMAARTTGISIANHEFCLTEWDQAGPAIHDDQCLHLRLSDALLAAKLDAAQKYTELKEEISAGIARRGPEYFRLECLRKLSSHSAEPTPSEKPFYEIWGEQRVSSGAYQQVIRFREHILPLKRAIMEYAATMELRRVAAAASP